MSGLKTFDVGDGAAVDRQRRRDRRRRCRGWRGSGHRGRGGAVRLRRAGRLAWRCGRRRGLARVPRAPRLSARAPAAAAAGARSRPATSACVGLRRRLDAGAAAAGPLAARSPGCRPPAMAAASASAILAPPHAAITTSSVPHLAVTTSTPLRGYPVPPFSQAVRREPEVGAKESPGVPCSREDRRKIDCPLEIADAQSQQPDASGGPLESTAGRRRQRRRRRVLERGAQADDARRGPAAPAAREVGLVEQVVDPHVGAQTARRRRRSAARCADSAAVVTPG